MPEHCCKLSSHLLKLGTQQMLQDQQEAQVEGWEEYAVIRIEINVRVYTVHPNHQCFFMCLLLHTVRSSTSFRDLQRYNGEVCTTYRDAFTTHGLLEDDTHWTRQQSAEYQFNSIIYFPKSR